MQKKSTKTEADKIKTNEVEEEVSEVKTGIESHPDYDPTLPESKQRHLR